MIDFNCFVPTHMMSEKTMNKCSRTRLIIIAVVTTISCLSISMSVYTQYYKKWQLDGGGKEDEQPKMYMYLLGGLVSSVVFTFMIYFLTNFILKIQKSQNRSMRNYLESSGMSKEEAQRQLLQERQNQNLANAFRQGSRSRRR